MRVESGSIRQAAARGPMRMTRTTVILCRHGESEGNREARFGGHSSTPLTELGRNQARVTAQRLARTGVDAVFSSDLSRAQETAEIIGQALRLPLEVSPALRERSVGIFTGLSFDEARERYPSDYQALLRREPDSAPPQGESYLQCRARATRYLQDALARHAGQRILLVSHHLTLYQLVLHILGLDTPAAGPRLYVRIDNCALHRFEHYEDGVWQVLALNDCAHLLTPDQA
jgi:probable phosphoglycerate mutase